MTLNFPGPHVLKFFYTVAPAGGLSLQHVQQLNLELVGTVQPGTLFEDIEVVPRVVAVHPLDVVVDEYVALLRPLFDLDDVTIDHAELWKVGVGSFDMTFISSYTIGLAATGIGETQLAVAALQTFRSTEGGIMRVSLMESMAAEGPPLVFAGMSQEHQDFVDYFINDSHSFFLARDTSYPLAFLRFFPGQNEATFKQRYR